MEDIESEIRTQQMVGDDPRVQSHLNIALIFHLFTAQRIFAMQPFSLCHICSYFHSLTSLELFLVWHHRSYFHSDITFSLSSPASSNDTAAQWRVWKRLRWRRRRRNHNIKDLGSNFGSIGAREGSKNTGSDEEEDTSKVLWENWWRPRPLCWLDIAWVQWYFINTFLEQNIG